MSGMQHAGKCATELSRLQVDRSFLIKSGDVCAKDPKSCQLLRGSRKWQSYSTHIQQDLSVKTANGPQCESCNVWPMLCQVMAARIVQKLIHNPYNHTAA